MEQTRKGFEVTGNALSSVQEHLDLLKKNSKDLSQLAGELHVSRVSEKYYLSQLQSLHASFGQLEWQLAGPKSESNTSLKSVWEVLQRWSFLEVSDVSLLRFAWQAWHFVTFRRVLQRVENRFAWQAQYFCDVFRRCVAVFVAGAALWTCPSSFFVAGATL